MGCSIGGSGGVGRSIGGSGGVGRSIGVREGWVVP